MSTVIFILIGLFSLILGVFGFCQIIGCIKYGENWSLISNFITVFLWIFVLGGTYALSCFWIKQYIWAVNIGYIVSFLLSLKVVPDEVVPDKNDIINRFKYSYNKISRLFGPYIKDPRCSIDIAAVLMVSLDFGIVQNEGKKQTVFEESAKRLKLLKYVHPYAAALSHTSEDKLEERMNFYAEFMREKQPRCDFNPFMDNKVDEGMLRVIYALCDIVYNPALIDDYDNAPVLITNFSDYFGFAEIMKKVIVEIASVLKNASKYH